MAPLRWSAAKLERASSDIRSVLACPSVDAAAGRLRAIMISPPGLEKQVLPSDSFAMDAQSCAAVPGSEGVRLGDAANMRQHMERAVQVPHPLQASAVARLDLQRAIEFVVAKREAGALAAARMARLESFGREAEALKKVDARLRGMQSGAARRLLRQQPGCRKPSVALWAALIRAMKWPDESVIEGLLVGFPAVGNYPPTGIFRENERPAEATFEHLDHEAHNAHLARVLAGLAASPSPHAQEALRQTERMTRSEVRSNNMRGPFYSAVEVERDIGAAPGSWRALHRFAIEQGTRADGSMKWRCCDNGKASGTNACLSSHETITCEKASFPALVAQLIAEQWPCHLPLPPMRHGTDDVASAYRRMPCAHPEATVVMVWDAERRCIAFYTMDGHNFGLSAAVLSFNRLTQLVATVARRFFGVLTAAYFDDYDTAEPDYAGRSGKSVLGALHEWLGMPLSSEKDVPMAVHNPFLGIVTDFSHFVSDGYVVMRPKPSRVEKLVSGLQAALAADYLPPAQADSWAGKLEFVTLSSGFHRVGRAAIREFRAFRDGGLGHSGNSALNPGLPEQLKDAMRFLVILLPRIPPRRLYVRAPTRPPIVIYTDASYEPQSGNPAGIGACVYDPCAPPHLRWVWASKAIPPEVYGYWRSRTQYIGQLEALAAMAVYYSLSRGVAFEGGVSHDVRERDVIHFVDNFGSMMGLIKGSSRDGDITRLAHVLTAIFIALAIRPWFEYVRSECNVSDLPSRFALEELRDTLPGAREFTYRLPTFWGLLHSSFVNLLEELSPRRWREWTLGW